jgi:hypothetical protein
MRGTRTFTVRISIRSMALGVVACALLLIFLIGSLRQSRLAREALARANAAEQAAARGRADADRAWAQAEAPPGPAKVGAVRRAVRRRDPKDAERVRQLYEEINGLSRIQERIQEDLAGLRRRAAQAPAPAGAGAP